MPAGATNAPPSAPRTRCRRGIRPGPPPPRVLGEQRFALRLEAVGNVPQENQPEDDMLVVRRLQILAQLIRREKKVRLEAKVSPVAVLPVLAVCSGRFLLSPRHVTPESLRRPRVRGPAVAKFIQFPRVCLLSRYKTVGAASEGRLAFGSLGASGRPSGYVSGNSAGNSISTASSGKRSDTGPFGVSEARMPSVTSAPSRSRALRSLRPVTRAASPRGSSPRCSACSSRLNASGFRSRRST